MPPKLRKTLKLGPKAMSVLFKPVRLEIYESLQIAGASSIAELAARLGRPADSLYYHVRKLLEIGVIEEHEAAPGQGKDARRSGPGRRGAVYAVAPGRIDARLNPASHRSREAWAEGGAAVLRLALRDFDRALESGDVEGDGPGRNLLLRRVKVRLDAAQLAEVNAHIDALHDLLCEHAENDTGELHAITCCMTPLEEKGKR